MIRRIPISAAIMAAWLCLTGCGSDPLDHSLVDWDRALEKAERPRASFHPPVKPGEQLAENADPVTTTDQGPLELTPEQAVVLALGNNRGLAVQQIDPAIAATFEQVERSIYDPNIFAEGVLARERRSETSRATSERFDVETRSNSVVGGVRQRLPTGTDIELGVETGRDASNRTIEQHASRVGLTLTQALLQGAGPAVNLVRIRQARLDRTASDYQLRGFTQALVAEVESTYWRYVLAVQEIRIFEQGLEVAEQLAEETREQIEVGVLPRTEAAAAEAEVALRRQDLIDARSEMRQLRLELLRLLNPGGQPDWSREIHIPEEPTIPPLPDSSVEEHVLLAGRFRPDVNEARVRLTQDRLEVVRTRNGLLPRLDLFITLGKTGFADSFNRSAANVDERTFDLSAGLLFEYPLGNRGAEALDRQARLIRRQASESVQNLIQLTELDVRQAFVEVERARQQVGASAATRRLREQALEAETEKLRVGTSTNLLVAQAQRDLLTSQIAEVEAIINIKLALIQLYRLDGTLLKRRGVDAPGASAHAGL